MYPYQNAFQAPNMLHQQQIVQVNGKASVDTIQLAPNSSILLLDTSAPIVWMCMSDGIGKVTAIPYDIVEHKEVEKTDGMKAIEDRISAIENIVKEMEEKLNAKSNVSKPKSKQDVSD